MIDKNNFTAQVHERGRELYRDMPWRDDTRPYYVLVRELMLQQTQVVRVLPKFLHFITRFPDVELLATAPLADVLRLWQGLGYNRRAKYLHDAAKHIVQLGEFPDTYEELLDLPGVGPNTAGAIMAYSYNQPVVYIETNIRTVYIHEWFADRDTVSDAEIKDVLARTIDREHPREFYWALMDYGAWLKTRGVRTNARSRHYSKQSPLAGSVREVRGQILRLLADAPHTDSELRASVDVERYEAAVTGLNADGLVERCDDRLQLTQG